MKLSTKTILFTATSLSVLAANSAQAQVALPTIELRGGGASSVAEIHPRVANCMGRPGAGLNQVGSNDGSLKTITPGLYSPSTTSASNPAFDCSTQQVQPNTQAKYVSTGSGTGRTMWRGFQTATSLDGTANKINPFTGGAGVASTWPNLQYAYSDSGISTSDLSTYNSTANSATNGAGAAIQFPAWVLPVAVAYNPAYGVKNTGAGNVNLKFNVKTPVSINGVVAGGLKLDKAAYCKIFNGEITNWNDVSLKTLNSNTALFDPTNDSLSRWTSEGAPIRLVGRADGSGTTDIFTRALAAQCVGKVATTLKFTSHAQALPYDNTSTIDIRRLQGSSPYFPGAASSGFAGTTQSLGGLVYDRVSHQICNWDETNASKQCDIAVKGTITSAPTPGLFMLADTSAGVNEAINGGGSNSFIASTTAGISLNGALGYIGADWVVASPGRTLFSAALQKGTTTAYLLPSAINASAAFGTALPPQTTAATGAYDTTDARTLGAVDPSKPISDPATNNGASVPVDRGNPLHWYSVLYNPNVSTAGTLADPAGGYPITGATVMLTYTCFKPEAGAVTTNNAKRFAIVELVQLAFGKITKTSTNATISSNTFKGTAPTALGILAQSNIALPSTGWITAINETFFKKSTQASGGNTLGARNLWIQDANPTTASDVDNIVQSTDSHSNPGCDPTKGA
jgi:hypothetical protein